MNTKNIDFVQLFKYGGIISFVLVLGSIILFSTKGLNYGVDFRGGVEIQVKFSDKVEIGELRDLMNTAKIPLSQLQRIGQEDQNEYLLKIQSENSDLNQISSDVNKSLTDKYGNTNFEILKNDIVGPKAGAQLRTSAFKALMWAVLAIMIYLGLRFDYKYAPGAIVALVHDSVIIIGAFVLTQKEFSLQIVAALLAIIGYSVNDTVVIYDRVREREIQNPGAPISESINQAIQETMSRTIMTSGTTLAVTLVMYFVGGPVIHDFFFAMSFGILVGTYSSVFIAVPMTVLSERLASKA
jgi:preprotein translocase subunit SecF